MITRDLIMTATPMLPTAGQQPCPHCGKPMEASTPAQDAPKAPPTKDAHVADEAPRSGWRDKPPLA